MTTDGGLVWSSQPLPQSDGMFYNLSCPTSTTCFGLVATSYSPIAGGATSGPPIDVNFVATTDGGVHWSTKALPTADTLSQLSCPSTAECVTIGSNLGPRFPDGGYGGSTVGIVLHTSNAGATWARGTLPTGLGLSYRSALTCPDARTCWLTGTVSTAPPIGTTMGPGQQFQESAVASSTDGGAAWQRTPLPSKVTFPSLDSISCSSALDCSTSGMDQIYRGNVPAPGQPGQFLYPYSQDPLILNTTDGGLTWSGPNLGTGNDYSFPDVGQLQCPGACIGLGSVFEGSPHTPVYREVPPSHPTN